MIRLLLLGILSALFFSSTFVLNRAMSMEGGHWFWTASLRFGYMFAMLALYLLFTKGPRYLTDIARIFSRFWLFWCIAGGIGFGVFYSMLCLSASYAPGWIIATTWQVTILATPVILIAMGRKIPLKGILLTGLIFTGIVLVNLEYAGSVTLKETILGILPVLVAAFAYPIGNQMVWEASQKGYKLIPRINHPLMNDSFARVLLMTLGSIPFWLALILLISPPSPSTGQLVSTAMVALFSGVIATTIFLHARHHCSRPYELAAVDATQSMEVVFSLLGEILLLHGAFPGTIGLFGISLTTIGLAAYARQQHKN
jgi:drug/metabolite transporter (DMT)-like permease